MNDVIVLSVEGFSSVNATRAQALWYWFTFCFAVMALFGAGTMLNGIIDQEPKEVVFGFLILFVGGTLSILCSFPV